MFVRLLVACAVVALAPRTPRIAHAAPATSSALIYAVGYSGRLAPIAQRADGSFRAIPADMAPPAKVHVIFGNRTIATLPATSDHG